jgi:hypothetical protein
VKQSDILSEELREHIDFSYSSFDRVVFRGYITGLFFEGQVIKLLRDLGFNNHSNGVLKLLTDQFNSHIKKLSEQLDVTVHWWGSEEKGKYKNKIDFVEEHYSNQINTINKRSKVICIIKATENVGTFANREIRTKAGKTFTKMYSCYKFVSQYYLHIHTRSGIRVVLFKNIELPAVCMRVLYKRAQLSETAV